MAPFKMGQMGDDVTAAGMITVTAAAISSRIPRRTILRAIALGDIIAVKTGPATAAWLIYPESFSEWVKGRAQS